MWVWERERERECVCVCVCWGKPVLWVVYSGSQSRQMPRSVPDKCRRCSNICGHPEVTINIFSMAAGSVSSAQVHSLRTQSKTQHWQQPEESQLVFHSKTSGGWWKNNIYSSNTCFFLLWLWLFLIIVFCSLLHERWSIQSESRNVVP